MSCDGAISCSLPELRSSLVPFCPQSSRRPPRMLNSGGDICFNYWQLLATNRGKTATFRNLGDLPNFLGYHSRHLTTCAADLNSINFSGISKLETVTFIFQVKLFWLEL